MVYDMIYLIAIGLTPGGSSSVHVYTQTIHRTTQSTQTIHRTTQFTNQEECGPCPVFARYNLAFALQLSKKRGKTSVRVAGECQLAKNIQNRADLSIRIHKHNNKNDITYTINPLRPELNPICYLLALLGAHHFLHVSRIRVKLLTLR